MAPPVINMMCMLCVLCRLAWLHSMAAPIFSTPTVNPATSTVVVAAVNGSLVALSHLGAVVWQCNLGAQLYAPLCLVPAPALDHDANATVVVGDAQGQLHAMDTASGQHLWVHTMPSTHSMYSMHSMQSAISTAATYTMHNTPDNPDNTGTDTDTDTGTGTGIGTGSHASAQQHTAATTDSNSNTGGVPMIVSCTNQGVLTMLSFRQHGAAGVDDSSHNTHHCQRSDASRSGMADAAVATAQLPGASCKCCSCMVDIAMATSQSTLWLCASSACWSSLQHCLCLFCSVLCDSLLLASIFPCSSFFLYKANSSRWQQFATNTMESLCMSELV